MTRTRNSLIIHLCKVFRIITYHPIHGYRSSQVLPRIVVTAGQIGLTNTTLLLWANDTLSHRQTCDTNRHDVVAIITAKTTRGGVTNGHVYYFKKGHSSLSAVISLLETLTSRCGINNLRPADDIRDTVSVPWDARQQSRKEMESPMGCMICTRVNVGPTWVRPRLCHSIVWTSRRQRYFPHQ